MSQPTDTTGLSTKTEKQPEVKKSSEEIQQALKNDQLAKIPLKKRGMKFSEDFDKTSSVIVTNPLPAPLREIPKILPTPDPANKVVNDHVNGEVNPTSEKHIQKISEPLTDKDGLVESVESTEKMVVNENERKDEKGQKDLTRAAEKITEATLPVDVRSPNVQVDKENVSAGEKAESLPVLGVIKTTSANHHTQDKASESKPADVRESCIVANLPRETDKSLATADSEIEKSVVEKIQSEETKMRKVEEAAPKQVEAEETAATPRLNEAKAERSEEKPKVKTTTVEKQHSEKDQSETSVDSEKMQLSPGAKKETVEMEDHGKKQDVTPTHRKDETKISDKSEETSKKSEETPVETLEKQQKDEIKDDSAAAQKKTPEEAQPVEKKNQVIRKDIRILDDGKQSDSKAEAMEVEETGGKQDQTEPQVDDETTEERSEGKDKTPRNASKEEDPKTETAHKEEKMECEEQAKPTEVEQSLSEVKPSNGEEANEPKDQENLTNDGKKRPCEDKDAAGTADRPITGKERGTETKTEQNDRSKTLTDLETVDGPLKEKMDAEKTAVEEKKEDKEEKKDGDEKDEAAKEVANGVKAPTEAARGKRPVHRRRAEVQREERTADSESDTNMGMSLRRSPRISRPTAKAVEVSDKKQEKVQTEEKQGEDKERKEGEEEEEPAVVEKVVQRKPREKKADQDGQTKPKVSFPFFIFCIHSSLQLLLIFPPHVIFIALHQFVFLRGGRGGRSGGPTLGRAAKSAALTRRRGAATTRRARRTTARRRRTTATKTTRWSAAGRGATATGRGGARTRTRPRTTTCPPTTTPASTAVFRTTRSWWVLWAAGWEEKHRPSHSPVANVSPCLPQILLCDSCDSGYHTACLRPPLMVIPDGEWFCPPCQHVRGAAQPPQLGREVGFDR